jgi:Fic family protein
VQQYPITKGYRAEGLLGHLRFALRYEPIDLGVYKSLFARMDKSLLEAWIQGEPHGIYARRAWYLYELLTGQRLDVPEVSSGRYVDLLNTEIHITGPKRLVTRQRINDNLLGTSVYCPLIRKTPKLKQALSKELAERARSLVSTVDPLVLKRATTFLYTKETKSSFAIEGETPSANRLERFVSALTRTDTFDVGDKEAFITLQNAIVDARYAQADWRDNQVYVGQTRHDYSQEIHFVCPKPEDLKQLMEGWTEMVGRLTDPAAGVDPVCAAAAAAFGFVFIHPFGDGNGRIHRFLIHHILSKTGFSPNGVLLPVSAVMLRDPRSYDRALEIFSKSVSPLIRYTMDHNQRMTVVNNTSDLYRYFDATPQAEYLYACIEETLDRDLKAEIEFLEFFDRALASTMEIVDMPNQRASFLVRLIHQNGGRLSKSKRDFFEEVTDVELEKIEAAVQHASRK